MTTNPTPTTATTPSNVRRSTRRLSRNQMAARGLTSSRQDAYLLEVIKIATRLAPRYAHNDPDRDDIVGRVLEHFNRAPNKYMAAYSTPAQYVNGTIWTRFQDFLRDERRQNGVGSVFVVLDDGTKIPVRRRVGLTIEDENGEPTDRPISDGIDAYSSVEIRVDVERVANHIDPKFLQAIHDTVITDEKAVVIARREGVAHTTIAHRVKRGQQEFAALLGDDYALGAL
jgi:DNA-directed RNA polymerase specialized sigma24 family protein